MSNMPDDLLSVSQAAVVAEREPNSLYRAIRKGKLRSLKDARGCISLRRGDIAAWLERPGRKKVFRCAWCGAEVARLPSQVKGLVFCGTDHSLEYAHMRRLGGIETPFEAAQKGKL